MSLAKYLEQQPVKYWLKSLDSRYKDIRLSVGKNCVGRSRESQISDKFCSKSQLTLDVDGGKYCVSVEVNGANASGFNGLMIEQGKKVVAKHDDVIEILYNKYPYKIEILPPPNSKKHKEENVENNNEILPDEPGKWQVIDNNKLVIYTSPNVKASEKIAGYDLDWTIIKTKSGNVFPRDTNDWELMLPEIPGKLKLLYKDGFKICFFTNQSGIGKGKFTLKDFKFRIESILSKLKVPTQVFISTDDGIYRKPVTGMWKYLEEHENDGIKISKEESFYIGDAAGRPEIKLPVKRKKDHSCVDRLFAMNIGITFFTPEEHFQNKKKVEWTRPEYDPKVNTSNIHLFEPENTKIPSNNCEIIIMVGLPGSGKSSFVQHHLEPLGYNVINADTLGSVQTCLNNCEKFLNLNKKCVIDNTNVDVETRKKFINLALKYNVECRCFLMNSTVPHIKHNLAFRLLIDKKHSKINDMVFNTMKKKFVSPSKEEGFKEIVKINLISGKFDTEEEEKLYKMYLLGK